ncbi:MAG: DUF4091 domain-containing protein [Candidatus Omnitrophica bacterium]|nr:DUF4091 domain-containing protein [Candidatus Omnitrophota bacterium]
MDRKDKIIFILSGILGGIFISVIIAFIFMGRLSSGGKVQIKNIGQSISHLIPHAGVAFYIGFESSNDASLFEYSDGAAGEISTSNASDGTHSLKVTFPTGGAYPGMLWEVYGSKIQNWSGKPDFHFDVYNNDERAVSLVVKIKSGRDYPKKSFEFTVDAEPMKSTHVSIPMDSIAEKCDTAEISYIKIFASNPERNIVLYFDNIGNSDQKPAGEQSSMNNVPASAKQPTKPQKDLSKLKDGFDVVAASSLDRIFKTGQTLIPATFSLNASIGLARQEYENFQIVVLNGKNPLENVSLSASSLKTLDGTHEIPAKNISIRVVGYVPTEKPYYPVKYVGEWPDPLLPLKPVHIEAGEVQPFWISIYADKDTPAGDYAGDILVSAPNYPEVKIPIRVHVFNFELPRESHLRTAFDFYPHITKNRFPIKDKEDEDSYKSRIDDINDKFIIEMVQHRMDPVLNIDPTNNTDLAKLDRYRWFGLSNFSVGKKGGTFDNNWPKEDQKIEEFLPLYRQYGELLALNKLLPYHYIYTWDEADIGKPYIAKIANMIHRAHPKLKNMMCFHGLWDIKKDPEWAKDIDIWCFGIDDYKEDKFKALVDAGKEMWVYVSGPGDSGAPNLALDFDSIDYRILPWMCWKLDIKGFLYWCVNWWELANPYQTAKNTKWEQNGNGLLFYPGENGPVMSIRTEIWRDGMEDYEYLILLKNLLQKRLLADPAFVDTALYKQAMSLLEIEPAFISSLKSFSKDGQNLQNRRNKIGEMIEKLK